MPKPPRAYLFHGSDSQASLEALHRWEAVFLQKYGIASRYLVEADEMPLDQVKREIALKAEGQTLFPEPKLIVVKRLASHEKGKGVAFGPFLDFVRSRVSEDDCTIVFWEDRLLPERSGIRVWFAEAELTHTAKVNTYIAPDRQGLSQVATAYAKQVGSVGIEKDALVWIAGQYAQLEKGARLAERLKATEVLSRDIRGWWLKQVIEQAALLAPGMPITLSNLRIVAGETRSVSVFELINAVRDGRGGEVRALLREWAKEQDDAGYFGLWSLLRIHYRKLADPRDSSSIRPLRLLGELEIISKNAALPYEVLTDAFFLALETGSWHIVRPKALWWSSLRSS
jgi:hypothetical protein